MKQIIQNMKSGETQVVEVPIPAIKPGYLLVRTLASLVSAGTERMLVSFAEKSLVGKAQSRPDLVKQVLEKAKREGVITTIDAALNRLDQPLVLGYSSAGIVEKAGSGVTGFKPGDRVVCGGGGFAVHAEYALIPQNLAAQLPKEVDFESGAFTTIGAIALNGIRLAKPQVGEKSAVIGMGLLGILTSQILQASGCTVIGMDIDPNRVMTAKKLGIQADTNNSITSQFSQLTQGRGFDHVFICADTQSNDPVRIAGEIARDRAHIIAIGAVGMEIPRKLYYEKELVFKVSRSYGPGRYDKSYEEEGKDYPHGYVRWTEGRNLEAIVDLLKSGSIDTASLITHRFPIDKAINAYKLIKNKQKDDYIGIIITYPKTKGAISKEKVISFSSENKYSATGKYRIGVLGAGNYANAIFLPIIKKNSLSIPTGIISAKGLNAQQSARKFGFSFAGSDEKELFTNNEIDIIAILTQHANHADQVVKGLKAGKHIYCEKPLALTKVEIEKITTQLKKKKHPYLTVGFNRRFAPYSITLKDFFKDHSEPLYAHYRVNAGFIPPSHWLHDPDKGGGRLIGEACHFIDFLIHLIGDIPESVHTIALPDIGKYKNDNFQISMIFADGSIGSISYLANGNKTLGKEYIEVFGGGKSAILDDFRELHLFGNTIEKKRAIFRQDKGHTSLWGIFIDAISNNAVEPIPYGELINTAYTVLACEQSLRTGEKIYVKNFISSK